MKRKKLFLALLGILVVISLAFAGSILWKRGPREGQFKSFTITKAWWPVWDTFQIGVQQREEAKGNIKTAFLQKEDYVSALNEFQTGNADAATLTIYEAILAASQGTPLKIVLLLDYTIGSDGIVARRGIRSVRDLKGRRIGVEQGTIAHFTVLKALEKAGLEKTEVQLVNLGLDELKQAFLDNEVDAVGIYEPYMSKLAKQGNGHILFSSREIPRAICDVLFVKESIVREHPDVIDHWIKAWNQALDFKSSEHENYLRTLSRLNGTPVSEIKESAEGIFFTNLAENRIAFGDHHKEGYLLESLREMEGFMLQQGVIRQSLNLRGIVELEGIQRFFMR